MSVLVKFQIIDFFTELHGNSKIVDDVMSTSPKFAAKTSTQLPCPLKSK